MLGLTSCGSSHFVNHPTIQLENNIVNTNHNKSCTVVDQRKDKFNGVLIDFNAIDYTWTTIGDNILHPPITEILSDKLNSYNSFKNKDTLIINRFDIKYSQYYRKKLGGAAWRLELIMLPILLALEPFYYDEEVDHVVVSSLSGYLNGQPISLKLTKHFNSGTRLSQSDISPPNSLVKTINQIIDEMAQQIALKRRNSARGHTAAKSLY